MSFKAVQLTIQDHYVVIDNGILEITISRPDGIITKIIYNGIENLLEDTVVEEHRGYWDLNWSDPGTSGTRGYGERVKGTDFQVVVENDEMVEVSFTRTWIPSSKGKFVPLNIDRRVIMLQGSAGFYCYGIYEKLKEWPGFNLPQTRIVFKLNKKWFQYMAVADNRQRKMPLPDDRLPGRCQVLEPPEAVLLTNPIEEEFKGEVDDKYQYSCEDRDLQVHGWICTDPPTGMWQITPSDEFRTGGPFKQNLTSHVGPYNLAMFISAHYAGEDMVAKFAQGEAWKRVFGPVFTYVNCVPKEDDWHWLWDDAKEQAVIETDRWPYSFPASEDYPTSDQRGNLSGRLLVHDRYFNDDYIPANGAYIGLASPNEPKSWQLEGKGYQFWTTTDEDGYFFIDDIRAGDYNLYASVPGFIGDYVCDNNVSVTQGLQTYSHLREINTVQNFLCLSILHYYINLVKMTYRKQAYTGFAIDMGELVYEPPSDGPTLWEVGVPDRTARKFYIPEPNPKYVNKLFVNHPERFRQYGLWERYAELYPNEDLVYTIGESDYEKDWFFAQVTRKKGNTYQGTTWKIKFNLEEVDQHGVYKLRLALATANMAELQVRVNDPKAEPPVFTTGLIGKDNAIARHGIHGLYRLYTADIQGNKLVQGDNTIYLTQAKGGSPFVGIMYDYIRLEGPPDSDQS
ncbi:probable rhamnogalacturonate lyase B isoform X1 [Chenopodium quinoa]|uniref:probable rhamnogalacturonate lyase B isoform X1 n=1 Tax=Chenopodium quinoa TaxID=63459 RepID=UPI000B77745B|nr:probable rhamnogalacturonate lyase B isoform X1 [Chenopodium quinoa]